MNARALLVGFLLASVSGPASAQFFFSFGPPEPPVVVVEDPYAPRYYDPYYNRPKVYRQPVYYESKTKTTHGNKVTTKTTIRNQNGKVVYENKSTRKKKKK